MHWFSITYSKLFIWDLKKELQLKCGEHIIFVIVIQNTLYNGIFYADAKTASDVQVIFERPT